MRRRRRRGILPVADWSRSSESEIKAEGEAKEEEG
jgi:hypothetical protein